MNQNLETIFVLLIDDDEDDYFLTRENFEDFEHTDLYELQWETSYDDGLKALEQGEHHVCLLDYQLGARDGVSLMRQAIDDGCTTPIIMLTGSGNRQIDQIAMREGAADYLIKGEITPPMLERSIRHSLERHRILEEQRSLAAENARLYDQAQRALKARDEIQRIVAHDLRSPLSIMSLALQLMERHFDSDSDLAREIMVEQIETQRYCVDRMNRLIQDLLDAARIEDGRLTLSRGAYLPGQLIELSVEQLQLRADDRSIELSANFADNLPRVDADLRRIEQVLGNLIGNSLKFTPEGGKIEVRANLCEEAVRFAVHDTGRGIPLEQLPHLFDRFWQGEEGDSKGQGLGLAICKGIIDAHDGRIWAESSEGEESTFYFTIPISDDRR